MEAAEKYAPVIKFVYVRQYEQDFCFQIRPAMIPSPSIRIHTDIFTIPLDGKYLIYAPLRRAAFLGNLQLANFISRLRSEEVRADGLTDEEKNYLAFFQRLHLTGEQGDRPIFTAAQGTFRPTDITLFLTNTCNLRCVYCYAEAGQATTMRMDMLTAKRGIDYVLANAVEQGIRSVRLSYHGGGEPTMNWRTLTESFEYAREKSDRLGIALHAGLATNGAFSLKKCHWITSHLEGATVSVDGSSEVQDAQRPFSSGRGSSAVVMKTMEQMDEAGFPYSLRMTVLSDSAAHLAGSVEYLLERIKPRKIIVEPVYPFGRGQEGRLNVAPEIFIAAFREARETGRRYSVEVQYSAARIDLITDRFCQSCGYGFSLTPAGSASACYEVCTENDRFADRFIFGSYNSQMGKYDLDENKLAWLQERTVDAEPWCRECFCRWHCAGDCPHKTTSVNPGSGFSGQARCLITRELTVDQILDKITQAGGDYWCERTK